MMDDLIGTNDINDSICKSRNKLMKTTIATLCAFVSLPSFLFGQILFTNGIDVAGTFVVGNGMVTIGSTSNSYDDAETAHIAPSIGQLAGYNPDTGSNIVFNGDLLTLRPKVMDLTSAANRQFVISAAQILGSTTLQVTNSGSNLVFSIPTGSISTSELDLSVLDDRYFEQNDDTMTSTLSLESQLGALGGIPAINISGDTNIYKFIRFKNSSNGTVWDVSMDSHDFSNRFAIWYSSNGTTWKAPLYISTNGVLYANGAGITNLAAGASEFTPIGNMQSTTIQSAIEELENEKLSLTGGAISGNLTLTKNLTVNGTISGDGSGLVNLPSSADNLGNHTATQLLNMAGYSITNATYYGDGSNLAGIITGDPSYGSSTGSPNEAVYVDDNGNIGIGTQSPDAKLHISGQMRASTVNIGTGNTVFGSGSAAHGLNCMASGYGVNVSYAEGMNTVASGLFGAHAEGFSTISSSHSSHAEGHSTVASGAAGSHAEGYHTTASGDAGSHSEGFDTTASGSHSHAEGNHTIASGSASHAAGQNAKATNDNTFVWSDGTEISSTTNNQFTVHALNGIQLLGGSISGDGSGLTNLSAGASKFTPVGNLEATNIQSAINELDTEKLALTGGTITGDLTVQGAIYGDGSNLINLPSSADNLGNHTATANIEMGSLHTIVNLPNPVAAQDAVNYQSMTNYMNQTIAYIPEMGDLSMGIYTNQP